MDIPIKKSKIRAFNSQMRKKIRCSKTDFFPLISTWRNRHSYKMFRFILGLHCSLRGLECYGTYNKPVTWKAWIQIHIYLVQILSKVFSCSNFDKLLKKNCRRTRKMLFLRIFSHIVHYFSSDFLMLGTVIFFLLGRGRGSGWESNRGCLTAAQRTNYVLSFAAPFSNNCCTKSWGTFLINWWAFLKIVGRAPGTVPFVRNMANWYGHAGVYRLH